MLSACIAAAEEGLGQEVLAVLRMRRVQSQPEQLKLTSAHADLLKVKNLLPPTQSRCAWPSNCHKENVLSD